MVIRKKLLIISIVVVASIFGGCEKEVNPCEIAKEGENYSLSDSAKTYINNYFDADRIIFKTLAGEEVVFEIIVKDTIGSYQVGFPCEEDTFKSQTFKGTSQILSFAMTNNIAISEPLIISLFDFPEIPTRQSQEHLTVSLGEYFSNSFGNGDELFYYNINSNNPQVIYIDSLEIGGKTFYSVYEMGDSTTTPKIEIKYTMNEGVIHIKDPQSLVDYIYERKE